MCDGRKGFMQRVFAWACAQGGDAVVTNEIELFKRRSLSRLQGTVLEIGPGPGANFAYFQKSITWVGLEPNLHMQKYLHESAAKHGFTADLRIGMAEAIGLPDASVDAVITTHVLCSVSDPVRALGEIVRVLKPGGEFVFVEHVAGSAGSSTRRLQSFVKPVWKWVADGCHPDRETWNTIEQAGFSSVDLTHTRIPYPIVAPHIVGIATR
jgi:ubiquinone/menaquinone biosynthesis C-methylase UbiE